MKEITWNKIEDKSSEDINLDNTKQFSLKLRYSWKMLKLKII